jgi:hypothetical protein
VAPALTLNSFKVISVDPPTGTLEIEVCFQASVKGFLILPTSSQGRNPLVEARHGESSVWHLEVVGMDIRRENGRQEGLDYELLPMDVDSTHTVSLKYQTVPTPSDCFVEELEPEGTIQLTSESIVELRTGFLLADRWENLRPRVTGFISETKPALFGDFIAPLILEAQSVNSWILCDILPREDTK